MKKSLFFLLGMLMITSASAAEYQYVPLVREGVKWVEYYENLMYPSVTGIITYQFSGATSFAGKNYNKLYTTFDTDELNVNEQPFAFVREEDKKVYVTLNPDYPYASFPAGYGPSYDLCTLIDEGTEDEWEEYLIYDFNDISSPYKLDYTGEPIVTAVECGGNLVNEYTLTDSDGVATDFIIRESIGTLHEAFINPTPMYPTNGLIFGLAWVEENGEIIYKGGFYEKAKGLNTSIVATHFDASKQVASVRYYNLAGVESREPFNGINIRVTTYSDGSRHSEKVIR